jgi:hypothetical protein
MQIRKHKNLEPKLWDKNNLLRKPVSDIILKMVGSYLLSVREISRVNIDNSDITDVFVYGSCANYFYNKKSDIDVCIVIDVDSVMAKNPGMNVLHNLKLYYYNWSITHRCRIYGRGLDVSFEDAKKTETYKRYRSGPGFSVLTNSWIFEPVVISDSEFKKIQNDANKVYRQVMSDYRRTKRHGFKLEEVHKLYSDIYAAKNMTHEVNVEQPITYMYIAFRRIRNRGLINILRDKIVELESHEFVLK